MTLTLTQTLTISGATGDISDGQVAGGSGTGKLPGMALIETKGGDLSDVEILWLGDSHARRIFYAAPDSTTVATGYAWLAYQQGWEGVLEDVVAQVTNSGGAPRVFISLGGRSIGVAGLAHNEVVCHLMEVVKKFVNQGVHTTIMELPFSTDPTCHLETWRTSCAIRGINTLLLGSSPAAGLLLQTVNTGDDMTEPLGLGSNFPLKRDTRKYTDAVQLKDVAYKEIWDETIKENAKTHSPNPRTPGWWCAATSPRWRPPQG